jgi:hypothetical protein
VYDPNSEQKDLFEQKGIFSENDNENNNVEFGTYGKNGDLIYGSKNDINSQKFDEIFYTPSDKQKINKVSCRKPTIDNPFMNPLVTDFNIDSPPVACNSSDDEIKDEIDEKFHAELYMNITDIFNIKNSQRQFYTIPSPSIPTNTIDFANWLYKTPDTCKENGENCLENEDLRYNVQRM